MAIRVGRVSTAHVHPVAGLLPVPRLSWTENTTAARTRKLDRRGPRTQGHAVCWPLPSSSPGAVLRCLGVKERSVSSQAGLTAPRAALCQCPACPERAGHPPPYVLRRTSHVVRIVFRFKPSKYVSQLVDPKPAAPRLSSPPLPARHDTTGRLFILARTHSCAGPILNTTLRDTRNFPSGVAFYAFFFFLAAHGPAPSLRADTLCKASTMTVHAQVETLACHPSRLQLPTHSLHKHYDVQSTPYTRRM